MTLVVAPLLAGVIMFQMPYNAPFANAGDSNSRKEMPIQGGSHLA